MASEDELRETVQHLKAALSTKQETVQQLQDALSSREAEIKRLREKVEEQGRLMRRRMQMIAQTKKERDELRRQCADLVHKLAEVGRRHGVNVKSPKLSSQLSSTSLTSPPSPSASLPPSHQPSPPPSRALFNRQSLTKLDSPLPPLPPPSENKAEKKKRTEEGSDTDYSDMEDEGKENHVKKQKLGKSDHRSPSPTTDKSSAESSMRKMSKPKPIIRNAGKSSGNSSIAGITVQMNPKKSVGFPTSQGLSSISEEEQNGTIGKNKTPQPVPSDDSLESSVMFESSMETSPPISPLKTSTDDHPSLPRSRRVTMSLTDFKKYSNSQDRSGEAEDIDSKNDDFGTMRSRVSTVSSSHGRYKEIGRKNSRQLKQEAAKLSERAQNFRHGGRKFQALELFSPDMELRIREKIYSAIGKKYGGLPRASRAAVVIQTAYRQYKLKKRYDEIRKEASHMRKRAQSLKNPRRNTSIIRKKRPQMRYQRQLTELAVNDPLLKAKLLSQELGKESVPHTSARRHLVEQKRSERALCSEGGEAAREEAAAAVDEAESGTVVDMETVVCEIKLDEEATPPLPELGEMIAASANAESTDSSGIPSSFSADVLLTSQGYQGPLSILSVRPSVSMDTSLSVPADSQKQEVIRARKMTMGIGHFNRKPTRGIQYLVKENVLPDSPQHVASFLAKQCGLSKEKIGEFVGEINSEFHMAVLECLLEQMDMKDKPIDEALRDFQILFRMPGEAQKIDKIMQMFALEYFRFNKDGVIKSEDAAYVLSFAIMMLHTSLHNPSVKNRTTKKQWVSMNRGCNDDENFPESLLHEIYDRISKREFTTGHDHTTEVCDIERNLIGYQSPSRLAIPQRRLMCRALVTKIDQLTSRPSFKKRRRRVLLVFSDQVIICKRRGEDQMEYRGSFSLMDALAISFETHHYRNGVQIYSSHDEKAIFQCNCDTSEERVKLLRTLEATISELKELEKERMAELGTTITKSQKDSEPERRHRMTSRAGDLLSSAHLHHKAESVRVKRHSKGDFVSGVGDLAMPSGVSNTIMRRTSRTSGTASQPENRTSGGSHESGYDSQRTTPVPSPSPTNPPHPNSSVPTSKRLLQARPSTTSAPMTLMTPATPVTRSKSTDQIHLHRVMTITPTLSRETKFPSAENLSQSPKGGSASTSPRSSKRKDRARKPEKAKKSRLPSLSSPFRLKRSSNRRGNSPVELRSCSPINGRPRTASATPSPPPTNYLELSAESLGRAKSYLVTST